MKKTEQRLHLDFWRWDMEQAASKWTSTKKSRTILAYFNSQCSQALPLTLYFIYSLKFFFLNKVLSKKHELVIFFILFIYSGVGFFFSPLPLQNQRSINPLICFKHLSSYNHPIIRRCAMFNFCSSTFLGWGQDPSRFPSSALITWVETSGIA